MFGKKNKRAPPPKGQGATAAKQMGLFLDFNPEAMMEEMNQNMDDPDLEAEFAAIVGKKPATAAAGKKPAKVPLPMEDIAKMTEECLKDVDDDDDDGDLEDDEDLLAELQEVVGEQETNDSGAETTSQPSPEKTRPSHSDPKGAESGAGVAGSVERTLQERIELYRAAMSNATAAGEPAKARRFERGLKTLQSMLSTARKGGQINEAEMPPPVASGDPRPPASTAATPSSPGLGRGPDSTVASETVSTTPDSETPGVAATPTETSVTTDLSASSPEEDRHTTGSIAHVSADEVSEPSREELLEQQKQHKMAALRAKQSGDLDQAKLHMKNSKSLGAVMEALEKGERVDLRNLPLAPSGGSAAVKSTLPNPPFSMRESQSTPAMLISEAPAGPASVLEALEQRMAKYRETCAQAKASGDERKARMYERIVKQYQSAIRAHKAGRGGNHEELPVPPGFPPMPGQGAAEPGQGLAAALEAAGKLASPDAEGGDEEEEEEEEEEESKLTKAPASAVATPTLVVPPTVQPPKRSPSPETPATRGTRSAPVPEQVEMLERRRKQYMMAALQAKQKGDLDQAKTFLRTAKSLEPLIAAAQSGKHVDSSKVPSPLSDEDEDFIMVHHADVQLSEKAEEVYAQLNTMLKEQHEKCTNYSKQFSHMGNVAETTKFENMAKRCKKSLEIIKLAQNRGLEPPKHHFEEKTYHTARMFPELSSTDMVVEIIRGLNLPAPHGVAPADLDAFVRLEFLYPSSDQPQRHKTSVVKNSNSPEYNQSFTLNINRNHRGFRRVVQSKGLKLEVFHKGGFLRSDKPVGTALVKLEKLETESEVREIVEVMDGRKATGGRLEVKVRLREPLSAQDMQTITERWLVLDQ